MESVILKYSDFVIENCEDAWSESVNADVTATADTSDKKTGSASAKFVVAGGVGVNTMLATEQVRPIRDISDCTAIKLWIKSSVNTNSGDLEIRIADVANCATPLESMDVPALTANTWAEITLTPGTPANLHSIISVGLYQVVDIGACSIWVDDIRAILPSTTFSVLSVKGVDDMERWAFYPAVSHRLLDGSSQVRIQTYVRLPVIDFGVIASKSDRLALFRWMMRPDNQRITYANEDVDVVLADPAGFEAVWLHNIDFAQAFTIELREKTARRTVPTSWLS